MSRVGVPSEFEAVSSLEREPYVNVGESEAESVAVTVSDGVDDGSGDADVVRVPADGLRVAVPSSVGVGLGVTDLDPTVME